MSKLYTQAVAGVVSRHSEVPFAFNSSEEADFCLNKCPHSRKPCKGNCREYKSFEKKLKEGK